MLYLETEKCNRIERKKLKNMEHILQITVHPQIKFIKVSEEGLMNAFTTQAQILGKMKDEQQQQKEQQQISNKHQFPRSCS